MKKIILLTLALIFINTSPAFAANSQLTKPAKTGLLILNAYAQNNEPYQGTFPVCEDTENPKCRLLETNRNGRGTISLPFGQYIIHSPNYCLPGENCLMDSPNIQVISPFMWLFSPSNIFIIDQTQKFVNITATQTSIL